MDGCIHCEVGSIVYGLAYPRTDIVTVAPEKVMKIVTTDTGIEIETDEDYYFISDFGKRFFLTKEEAENAATRLMNHDE